MQMQGLKVQLTLPPARTIRVDISTCHSLLHSLYVAAIPALVVTIQEMRISINVLKKIAIVGRFAGFCARFSDGFTVRQKHWSTDHKRKGLENSGEASSFFCHKLHPSIMHQLPVIFSCFYSHCSQRVM